MIPSHSDYATDFDVYLANHPEDLATHLVYADFLEDHGRPLAAHWHREVGARHVAPWDFTNTNRRTTLQGRRRPRRKTWVWVLGSPRLELFGVASAADLPPELFALLGGKPVDYGRYGTCVRYCLKLNAWHDLFKAIGKLDGEGRP